MADRDRSFALGVAAGAAVAAVGAAGAVALRRLGGREDGHHTEGQAYEEEASGRGTPAQGPDPASLASGYDLHDAKVGALVKVMVVSLGLMIGSTAAVFALYAHFDRGYQATNVGLTTQQRAAIVPPLPHLQAEPFRDLDAATMQQTRRLTTYGWTSPDHEGAHIPIDEAAAQVVGKPLDGPAQAAETAPSRSTQPPTRPLESKPPETKP